MTSALLDQFKLLDGLRKAAGIPMDRWARNAGIHWMHFCEIKLGMKAPTESEIASLTRALGMRHIRLCRDLGSNSPASSACETAATSGFSSGVR